MFDCENVYIYQMIGGILLIEFVTNGRKNKSVLERYVKKDLQVWTALEGIEVGNSFI